MRDPAHSLPSPPLVIGLAVLFLCSPPLLADLASAGPASSRMERDSIQRVSLHKVAKSKKRARAIVGPTVVHDIRVRNYPNFLRLVLDLQRSVTFTQSRQGNERVIIELQNSFLGRELMSKLSDKELPEEVTIAQPHPRSVTISLNLGTIRDYRLLPLTRPNRLVLDLYGRTPDPQSIGMTESPPSPPSETPAPAKPANGKASRGEIKTIVIDPGHGGKDPGAIGHGRSAEKDVTLRVALLLREMLAKQLGKRVALTREKDVFVDLEDRAKYANALNADLFISIHVNSHPQRATRGVEIYHFGEATDRRALEVAARENGTPIKEVGVGWEYLVADLLTTKKAQESLELAWTTKEAMINHLDDHYDVVDHGVKTAPFYVLRYTAMPSILAEIAFISNPSEERLMQSEAYLGRMAEAIFDGVRAFIQPVQTASR
jgi:N-acetylmuramoyl-L-alanine amidase